MEAIAPHADIMITIIDSYFMKSFAPKTFYDRTVKAIWHYHPWAKAFEVANEMTGHWIGPYKRKFQKCANIATDLVRKEGFKSVITWYYDGNDPDRMFDIGFDYPCNADYHLISWYPNQSPGFYPKWQEVFDRFAEMCPEGLLGFGEFGCEPKTWTPKQKAFLIEQMYDIKINHPRFIGGYFYWNAYEAVMKKEQKVLNALRGKK